MKRPSSELPRLRRALTSAPALTSSANHVEAAQVAGALGGGSPSPRFGLRTQVIVCSAREARPLVVGVGAGFQQGDGQLEVAVLDGQDQRRGPQRALAGSVVCWVAWPR